MKELDERIREALATDEEALAALTRQEADFISNALGSFRGRNRFLVLVANIWTFLFFLLMIYSVWQVFQTKDVQRLVQWAILAIFSMTAMSGLKLWWFMEMNKNAVVREVKRVELQLARVAAMLEEGKE